MSAPSESPRESEPVLGEPSRWEDRAPANPSHMVEHWLGPWSPHPAFAERNLRRWKRWGIFISIGLPTIFFLAMLTRAVLNSAGRLTEVFSNPLKLLGVLKETLQAFMEPFGGAFKVLLFVGPAGMAFAMTAMLTNLVADHVTQTRGPDVGDGESDRGSVRPLADPALWTLVLTALSLATVLWLLLVLADRFEDDSTVAACATMIALFACPVLLEIAGAKRSGVPLRWWTIAVGAWSMFSLFGWLLVSRKFGSGGLPGLIVGSTILGWCTTMLVRLIHSRSNKGDRKHKQGIRLAEPNPEIRRALPHVPSLPAEALGAPGHAVPRNPSSPGGSDLGTKSGESGDDSPTGAPAQPSATAVEWLDKVRIRLSIRSWIIQEEQVSSLESGNRASPPAEGNPARALFWGPPTSHQLRALDGIRELRAMTQTRHDDRGKDVVIEGLPGSGRSTLLLAAALDAVLEGHDVLLIVPDESRREAAVEEIRSLIGRHALKGFLRAASLDADAIRPSGPDAGVLPEVLVATVEDVENHFFGFPASVPEAWMRRVIALRDVILVDDLVEMPDQSRAHAAFVLEKLRLVMRMQGAEPQVVMTCPPLAQKARNSIAMRMLSTKGEPNRFDLLAAAESFDLVTVMIEAEGLATRDIDARVESAIAAVAGIARAQGARAAVMLPGRSHSQCESMRDSIDSRQRSVPVAGNFDGLRTYRRIIPAWSLLRARTDGARGVLAINAPDGRNPPVVIAFRSERPRSRKGLLHVLPVLPSSRAWTFVVRHLRSVSPVLPARYPLDRDHWARLGLGAVGSLNHLPSPSADDGFEVQLQLLIDPCEFDKRAIASLDRGFWPWVCRENDSDASTMGTRRHPVDLSQPPSFDEGLLLDPSGTRLSIGRRVPAAVSLQDRTMPSGGAVNPSTRAPAPGLSKPPRSTQHRLRWFNDQGRQLGADGTSDLAYGDDLLFRSGGSVYFAQRIDGHDTVTGELRVIAQPSVGAAGETQNPVWRCRLRIPEPKLGCLQRLNGGPLGKSVIRFDLQKVVEGGLSDNPTLEQRRRRRTPRRSDEDLAGTPSVQLKLLGALDTAGTRQRLNAEDIQFEHAVRGVTWLMLRTGLTDAQYDRVDNEALKGLCGDWCSDDEAARDAAPAGAAWRGQVWPELSAALQIALRETLPGSQFFGKVVAFHPARSAEDLGVRACVFFFEPLPTEETVSDAINSLALDPDLVHALLERCMLELEATDRPLELSLRARTNWENLATSDQISSAAQLLTRMLSLVRPAESADRIPWLDQAADLGMALGDINSDDLGLSEENRAAILSAMESEGQVALASWLRAPHGLKLPRPDLRLITFRKWQDYDRTHSRGKDHRIQVSVDHALAAEIERHFGVPNELLRVAFMPNDAALAQAWARAWNRSLQLHGLHHDLMINAAWHVRVSTDALRPVAEAIVRECQRSDHSGLDDRSITLALASYVQNAVPYRRIHEHEDGKYRYGFRTPLSTLLEGGDCDSKSMLLISLLRSIRPSLPVALIHIDAGEPHAMLGVGGIAADGEIRKMIGDTEYVLIESTADWNIGRISDDSDETTIQAFPIPRA